MAWWLSIDIWPSSQLVPMLGRALVQSRRPCEYMHSDCGVSSMLIALRADGCVASMLVTAHNGPFGLNIVYRCTIFSSGMGI